MGEWIGAAEAAQRLGVKPATLYAYVSRGVLRRRRGADGRSGLFDPAEVAGLADRSQPRRPAATAGIVIESAVTEISDGPLRYRGVDVAQLALWRPFEEVADWLWSGSPRKDGPPAWQDTSWQATAEAVAAGTAAQAAPPRPRCPRARCRWNGSRSSCPPWRPPTGCGCISTRRPWPPRAAASSPA